MQSFPVTVRKACTAEAAEAFDAIEEYCNEIGVIVRDSRAELEQYLCMDQGGIWLAWKGTIVAGCILLLPLAEMQNAGEIKRLYVRQTYRGRGVAEALLLALENYAAAHGIDWLYLDTKQDLQAAIRFYERCGYRPCERYNNNPQATIFMRKQLL